MMGSGLTGRMEWGMVVESKVDELRVTWPGARRAIARRRRRGDRRSLGAHSGKRAGYELILDDTAALRHGNETKNSVQSKDKPLSPA